MKQERHRIPPQGRNPTVAQPHNEMLRQLRATAEELQKVVHEREGFRRLLWLIIHEQSGITIHEDAYRAMRSMTPEDCAFKLVPNSAEKNLRLVECDKDGNDISAIIKPDDARPGIIIPPGMGQ